jgi:hypothetical protein
MSPPPFPLHEAIGEIRKTGSTVFSLINMTNGLAAVAAPADLGLHRIYSPWAGAIPVDCYPIRIGKSLCQFSVTNRDCHQRLPNVLIHLDEVIVHPDSHLEHL